MSRARRNQSLRHPPHGTELRVKAASWLVLLSLLVWLGFAGAKRNQTPPPDGEWTANAEFSPIAHRHRLRSRRGAGCRRSRRPRSTPTATSFSAKPRVGVIREYDMDLKPTGRVVWLRTRRQAPDPAPDRSHLGRALRNISGRHRAQEGRDLPARLGTRLARRQS